MRANGSLSGGGYLGEMVDEAKAIRAFIKKRRKEYDGREDGTLLDQSLKSGWRNYTKLRQSHEERFPFELLQNMHDAYVGDRTGHARFVWTESALLVADDGEGFSLDNVESICIADSTQKRGDRSTIGQKGVGFAAVYQLTDFPQIFTHHDVFFGFDLPMAAKEKVAPLWVPHELDPDSYADDLATIEELRAGGAVTVIRLPFKDPDTQYEATFDSCVEQLEPELLLFMPKLKSFSLERGSEIIEWKWSLTGESVGVASVVELSDTSETRSWLVAEDQIPTPSIKGQEEDDQWTGVDKLGCGVAVAWRDGELLVADEPDPICVYYPTTDTTGLQFRFHADFLVDGSRSSIRFRGPQRALQEPIIEQIAIMTAEMCDAIVTKGGRSSAWDLLEFLGHSFELSSPSSGLGQSLFDEVVERLKRLEIIPVVGRALRTAGETQIPAGITLEGYKTLIEETPIRSKSKFVYPSTRRLSKEVQRALKELGTEWLGADEIASLIESGDGYEAETLYGSLRAVDEAFTGNRSAWRLGLKSRPIVCATDGTWLCPRDVYFAVEGLPADADTVLNLELVEPPSESSREFLEELGIKKPDPEEIVIKLEALVADFPDLHELTTLPVDQASAKLKELRETSIKILNILGVYWRSENDEFRSLLAQFSFGNLFIPVKKVGSTDTSVVRLERRDRYFRPIQIYLDKAWTGSDALERLYERFERFEFLDHKQLGDLWDPADQLMRGLPLALGMKDKVHQYLGKVDRVTEIVEAPELESSKALLDLWADIAPLVEGEDQAKTLATERWVPAGERFVAPIETWYNRKEPHATKVLPLTPAELRTGPVAGNDYNAPSARGLASGLQYLCDLQNLDEEVLDTARHFLRRFSEKISQDKPSESDGPILRHLCQEPPPMPAYKYGEPTWLRTGDEGHFWDLPSDPPDTYVFPTLKDNESALIGLLDIDSVRRASEMTNATPELPADIRKKGCLEPQQRLAVAALLMKEGIDLWELANLSEKRGSELHLRLSAKNFSQLIPCVAFLQIPKSAQSSRRHVDVSGSIVVSDGAAKAQTPAEPSYPILWTDMTAKPIDLAMEMTRLFRNIPPERYKQASKDLLIVLSSEQQGWQKLLELDQERLDQAEEALEKCRSNAASESEENGFADENDPATEPQIHLPATPAEISDRGDSVDSEVETIDVNESLMTNESGAVSHFTTDITEPDSTKTSSGSEALEQQQVPVRRTPPTSKPKMRSAQPVPDPEAVDDQTPTPVENLARFEKVAEEITPATVTSDGYRQSDLRPLVEPDDSWLLRLTSEDSDFEARYDSVSATSSRPSAGSRTRDDNRSLAPPRDWRQMEDIGFRHIERILREYFSAINIRDVRDDLGIPGVSRGPGCDLICDIDGVEHYIELKTMGYEEGSFELTPNERRRLIEHRERYWVMVVSSLRTEMHIIKLVKNLHEKTGFVPVPENEVEKYRVPLTLWKRCVDENKNEWNFGPAD